MAIAAWALASLVLGRTGSIAGAVAGAALLLAQPERALPAEHADDRAAAVRADDARRWRLTADVARPRRLRLAASRRALALVAACMTRYEAWPISGSVLVLALAVLLRRGMPPRSAAVALPRLAAYPALAVVALPAQQPLDDRRVVRHGAASSSPRTKRWGTRSLAWDQVREGSIACRDRRSVWPAYAGCGAWSCWARSRDRGRGRSLVLVLALGAPPRCRGTRIFEDIPFRIRYGVPLVAAVRGDRWHGRSALLPRRCARVPPPLCSRGVAAVAGRARSIASAPMVVEAQRDAPNSGRARRSRLICDASRRPADHDEHGVARALHAGPLAGGLRACTTSSTRATASSGPHAVRARRAAIVGWVADRGARRRRGRARCSSAAAIANFLAGFARVAEGGGVALYDAQRTVQPRVRVSAVRARMR